MTTAATDILTRLDFDPTTPCQHETEAAACDQPAEWQITFTIDRGTFHMYLCTAHKELVVEHVQTCPAHCRLVTIQRVEAIR